MQVNLTKVQGKKYIQVNASIEYVLTANMSPSALFLTKVYSKVKVKLSRSELLIVNSRFCLLPLFWGS